MDIQIILQDLADHNIPQPQVWHIDETTVDLNWDKHGVFCTFDADMFSFTKVHPSGDLDKTIDVQLPRADVATIKTTFLKYWKAWKYTLQWGILTNRLCDASQETPDGEACPSHRAPLTCT